MAGLEPAQLKLLPPQDSVSTNSTTSAVQIFLKFYLLFGESKGINGNDSWFSDSLKITVSG